MPNTLIHLAAQSAASAPLLRARTRTARRWEWDWHLVFLGAVLPDSPWILQRALRTALLQFGVADSPAGDPIFYDLRLIAGVQGSLVFCLLLASACALPSRRPCRTFGILSFGIVLHLLLDATQIKWANGVLLAAPFDWHLLRFDWVWPEHPAVPWLSVACFAVAVLIAWRIETPSASFFVRPFARRRRWISAAAALALYVALPFALVPSFEASGAYSVAALRQEQPGASVELGNAWVFSDPGSPTSPLQVRTMSERRLAIVESPVRLETGRWSLRGTLVQSGPTVALRVTEAHRHRRRVRESFSLAGLGLVAVVWLRAARHLV